jgi:thioredoxin-like negative regulator of GroEL
MAGGDWAAARDLWEQIIHREEENVIARVELSRCLEALNDPREALRVLDSTRASSRSSAEVLFRAAELNRKLGNNTAASDNLGLILKTAPSRKALELARDINEELGRIGDAIEFQSELEKIGYASDDTGDARRRLTFAQIVTESTSESALRDSLTGFVKRNPTFVPALEKLAALEISRADVETSAELLVKAAKAAKGDVSKWKAVVDLWLHATQGEFSRRAERAIAAARSASQDTKGRVRLEAELLLIRTLLAANRFQDAERAIDALPSLAERELKDFPADIHEQWVIQKGHSLAQMGKARDTASLWEELAAPGQRRIGGQSTNRLKEKQAEPSPALSTP